MKSILSLFSKPTIVVSLFLGFASGLPLALTGSTLQAWYAKSNVSLLEVSFVGLVSIPYTLKFLWAPFMDRFVPPFLGRRRGWILVCQSILCLALFAMIWLSPDKEPSGLMFVAALVAFISASQDVAIDAYRVDILQSRDRPLGAAMAVNGYRIAMLVSGGIALVLAHHWGFRFAYLCMIALTALGTIATFLGPEPLNDPPPMKSLQDCVVLPFLDFFGRPQSLGILLFIVCYKLGDAFAGSLSQTFLIREINMSLLEIGTLIKFSGFIGTILGTIAGGLWMTKLGWFRSLYIFGILQALANLLYMPLIWTGANNWIAGSAIFADNFFGGMGTSVFVGLLMGLCNPRFTAFQYSLLSALSAVGRVFISPTAGFIAQSYGWESFFISSVLFALPGLFLLFWLKNSIEKMNDSMAAERQSLATANT